MAKPTEDFTKMQLREEKARLLTERRELLRRNNELQNELDDAKALLRHASFHIDTVYIEDSQTLAAIDAFLNGEGTESWRHLLRATSTFTTRTY